MFHMSLVLILKNWLHTYVLVRSVKQIYFFFNLVTSPGNLILPPILTSQAMLYIYRVAILSIEIVEVSCPLTSHPIQALSVNYVYCPS